MARRRPRHAAPPTVPPRVLLLAAAVVAAAASAAAGSAYAMPDTTAAFQPPAGLPEAAPAGAGQPAPGTVTITATGDVVLGSAPDALPPGGPDGFFDRAAPALDGDVVVGNFEGVLTERSHSDKCGDPPADHCAAYRVPPGYASALAGAGFDVLNLANNHALDYGFEGLADTQRRLGESGISYTGMRGEYAEVIAGGVGVGVVGVSPYAWSQDVHDIEGTAELVASAARRNDVVIVTMQAGAEGRDADHVVFGEETYLGERRGDVAAFAHAMVDAGADAVFGHGPHVLRGMEFYRGRLIAYSLGNFAGYGVLSGEGNRGIGAAVDVTLTMDGEWVDGTMHATRMVDGGYPAVDPDDTAHGVANALSTADFGDTAALVTDGGGITPP